jgi:hypothetical protein
MQENNELLELQQLRRERAIEQFIEADRDIISPRDAAVLIGREIQSGPSRDIDITSAQAALQRLKESRPYFCRSARQDHGTMQGVPPAPPKSDKQLAAELFGPESSGAAANRLALANRDEYHRLKQIAIDRGIF